MNHAVMNNKGHVLDIFATQHEAQQEADRINAQDTDVFCWTVETTDTAPQDMPGQGVFW